MILTLDVLGNEVHGSRTVQGNSGNDVLHALWLQFLHESLHAAAFQLEHAVGLTGSKGSVNRRVVIIYFINVYRLSGSLGRHTGRVLNDRQGTQAQKIHFQKAQLFQGSHDKLSGDGTVGGPGQGYIFVHGFLADNDARRVHGCVSRKSLQTHGHVDELLHLRVIFVALPKLRIHFQGFFQSDIQLLGHHFRDGIHKIVRQIHNTAHVPDDAPGRHGTKGYDLYYPVLAVFADHIVDDLLTTLKAEIHVDIRHGHTLRIQKTLEQQLIAHGVDVGDSHGIGNDASGCGSPPRAYRYAVLSGIMNEVPDDQEIIYIAHLLNDAKLVGQTVAHGAVVIGIAL